VYAPLSSEHRRSRLCRREHRTSVDYWSPRDTLIPSENSFPQQTDRYLYLLSSCGALSHDHRGARYRPFQSFFFQYGDLGSDESVGLQSPLLFRPKTGRRIARFPAVFLFRRIPFSDHALLTRFSLLFLSADSGMPTHTPLSHSHSRPSWSQPSCPL